jgi:hypothetical protein
MAQGLGMKWLGRVPNAGGEHGFLIGLAKPEPYPCSRARGFQRKVADQNKLWEDAPRGSRGRKGDFDLEDEATKR